MENQEEIHDILTHFEKKPSQDIPTVLEEYLRNVAKTGKILYPWSLVKPLFVCKLEQVMEQFHKDVPFDHLSPFPNVENVKYTEMKSRIVDSLQKFNGAPFTVQRICELVTQPRKHYTRCDKFLRGIEKNVQVVSSVDTQGTKIVSESSHGLMNGLDVNGFSQQKNDITDGQPFAPVPLTEWSSSKTLPLWPGMQSPVDCLDAVIKSSSSDAEGDQHVSENASDADQNVVEGGSDADRPVLEDAEKLADIVTESTAADSSPLPGSTSSSTSASSSEITSSSDTTVTDSVTSASSSSPALASGESVPDEADAKKTMTFDFQTLSESGRLEQVETASSNDKTCVPPAESSSSDDSKSGGEEPSHPDSCEADVKQTESPTDKQVEAVPDVDSRTDDSEEDGPPEKKRRVSEPEDDRSVPVSEAAAVETTEDTSQKETEEASNTVSADSESKHAEEENKECEQKVDDVDEEPEETVSRSSSEERSDSVNTELPVISSTDDVDKKTDNVDQCTEPDSAQTAQPDQSEAESVNSVSQSEVSTEETGFTVSDEAFVEATPDEVTDSGGCGERCDGSKIEEQTTDNSSECNSTTEMMETDAADHKTEETITSEVKASAGDGQEPMEQE